MRQTIKTRFLPGHILLVAIAAMQTDSLAAAAYERGNFKVQVVADDMCCQGCAQKIAGQLYAAPGVTSVEADIPNRIVKVTANRTAKLTLERLWRAVEKGKGGPSKLITAEATYTLIRPDKLKPEQRLPAGQYVIRAPELGDQTAAERIATQLSSIRGVLHMRIDATTNSLIIQSTVDEPLSMWTLCAVLQQEDKVPATIGGPHGLLTIERSVSRQANSGAFPSQANAQGEVR
jgi:copper chaperone CopZ